MMVFYGAYAIATAAATEASSLYKIGSNVVCTFILKVSLIKTKFYHFDYVVKACIYIKVTNGYSELCDVVVTKLRTQR